MRHLQVICSCSAYTFPHRVNSGTCTGADWSGSYREIDGEYCQTCNCLASDNLYDVTQGAESIAQCEGYQDYLHTQTSQRLPMSLSDLIASQYGDYAGGW